MVREYLENYLNDLLEKRIQLEKEYGDLENRIRENIEFINLLEEKNDPNYESFTPRTVNSANKKKIQELNLEQKELSEAAKKKKAEVNACYTKVAELTGVIRVARESELDEDALNNIDDNTVFRLKLLETQETERQRIARELHDSSVQNLTSLVYKSELCTKLIDMDPIRCKLELVSMSKSIKDIINEMRQLIYDLRPMSFDDIGIDVTMGRELERLQSTGNVKINYYVEGSSDHVKPVVGLTLLRVVQEACNNAIKHADASKIDVRFVYSDHEVNISIEDDGCGFDVDQIKVNDNNSGFGLPMMKERIYLLSGKITIQSEKEKGTRITVAVPIVDDKEETK